MYFDNNDLELLGETYQGSRVVADEALVLRIELPIVWSQRLRRYQPLDTVVGQAYLGAEGGEIDNDAVECLSDLLAEQVQDTDGLEFDFGGVGAALGSEALGSTLKNLSSS